METNTGEAASSSPAARTVRAVIWAGRRASSRLRTLPTFVIIGAPRSGTTSVYQTLTGHPQVAAGFRKEVHFFDGRTERGVGWYTANFPLRYGRTSGGIAGEATPNYLSHPEAPRSAFETVPGARLIAILRNPIDRAHSSWRLKVSKRREHRSFGEAVRAEDDEGTSQILRPKGVTIAEARSMMRHAYLEKSRYAEHLERWLEYYPREQLLVIRSEDLFNAQDATMHEIHEFIGCDPALSGPLPHLNSSPPAEIDDEDRTWLRDYFAPHNRKLEDITGLTFGWN